MWSYSDYLLPPPVTAKRAAGIIIFPFYVEFLVLVHFANGFLEPVLKRTRPLSENSQLKQLVQQKD